MKPANVLLFILIVSAGLNVVLFNSLMQTRVYTYEAIRLGNEAVALFNDYQHNIVEACSRPEGQTITIKLDDGHAPKIYCKPELGL